MVCRRRIKSDHHAGSNRLPSRPVYGLFDYVPASEIPGVLNRSSILLQLANTFASDGPKGFMTTKLFESMAVGKPLLCVKSDESCLEATIRNTRSGLAARTAEEAFVLSCTIISSGRIMGTHT